MISIKKKGKTYILTIVDKRNARLTYKMTTKEYKDLVAEGAKDYIQKFCKYIKKFCEYEAKIHEYVKKICDFSRNICDF